MDFTRPKHFSPVPVLAKQQARHGSFNGLGNMAEVATPDAGAPIAWVETLVASSRTDIRIPANPTTLPAGFSAIKSFIVQA